MRVCVVAPAFPPVVGGGESLVASLTEALCRKGVTVHVLTSVQPSPEIVAAVAGAGGSVRLPRPPRPGRLQWEHEAFYKAEALERLLAEEPVDVVHTFSYDAAVTAAVVCPRGDPGRVPVVGTFSEMTVRERATIEHLRAQFVFSLDALDLYIAISEMYANMALAHGLPPERLRLNKAGIDIERFAAGSRPRGRQRLGVDDRTFLVSCPSRFSKRKGQLDLLQAMALLEPWRTDVQLVLAGSINSAYREDLEAIQAMAARRRLRRPVRILEDLPRDDMPDLLAASDLVVLPSHYEGLGLAALEAMAAGTCVLLADTVGLNEVAVHGETAWYVPPRSPEALALALRELTDADLRRRLAGAARAHVRERFSMAATADRMTGLYQSLLRPDGGSRSRRVRRSVRPKHSNVELSR